MTGGGISNSNNDGDDENIRLEVSISSTIADAFGFTPFSRVVIKRVNPKELNTNFVEFFCISSTIFAAPHMAIQSKDGGYNGTYWSKYKCRWGASCRPGASK